MSGSVQELMAQAREMLASQGAPVTTENLNRAMLALSQNQSAPSDGFDMNAQVDRVMQRSTPRRANATPTAATTATTPEAAPTAPTNTVVARADNAPATPVGVDAVNKASATETASVGSMPTGRIPEDTELTGPNPLLNAAMQRALNQQPVRMPVVSAELVPDESAGLGYDPRTEELDQYGRPQMRGMRRAEPTNNILSPAYLGIPAAAATALAGPAAASLTRVTPRVAATGTRTATPPRAAPMANAVDLTQALPGVARPAAQTRTVPIRQAVDDMVGTPPPAPLATAATATPRGVTPPLTPQQIAELSARNPRVAAGLAEARRVPGASAELSPMQRATLMGPGPAADAAVAAARTRAGTTPKPRNMSAAQRQRRQNIAESP